mgnify:CR=1 FL=1
MAKRYTRINWQNKPSVATPISAENLNIMDKGIKDCDDAIGDLALLNTTNKDDLVKAVNELLAAINALNNNLANYTLPTITVTSQADLDAVLDNLHNSAQNGTYYRRTLMNESTTSIGGIGVYLIEGFRQSSPYGWQRATIQDQASGYIVKVRGKSTTSSWGSWITK